jgi:hypothetical protein
MGEFLREIKLHFTLSSDAHKGFPNTQRGALLCGLRSELPDPTSICRPADSDAEVCGAVWTLVVIPESRQYCPWSYLAQKHVIHITSSAGYLGEVLEGTAVIGTFRDAK